MKTAVSFLIVCGLCAWADAQQTTTLTAADRLKQLQSNRKLVEKLVGHGVSLANANEPLKRAGHCRSAMGELTLALDGAIREQDASRVAELGEHLAAIVNDGLIPNLKEAKPNATPASPAFAEFIALHTSSTDELQRLQSSVPQLEALGRSAQVKAMLANLSKTNEALAKAK